ncbi:MAG: dihydroorotate dehydrogenase electron transfer subunit [Thermodesulfobacteriota bacterium]
MMIQKTAAITENRPVSGACWKMTLAVGTDMAAAARPGQFVMVRVPDGGLKPFLSRPFSIHRINKERGLLELLYRVVGHGTRQMASRCAGQTMELVGPLGNGFRIEQPFKNIAFVAGGMGVAPLVFLAETLVAEHGGALRARAFIGGACGEDLLCCDVFAGLNMDVAVATEDGCAGCRGFVTQPFENAIKTDSPEMVMACGPPAMLAAVAKISAAADIPCQVSIESLMACGIGACLGCAVKSSGNANYYKHVCKDGPVFAASEIDLDGLAASHGAGQRAFSVRKS